jgi:hypothetical protein
MPVIQCPNGHHIQVTDRHLGQTVKCPTCQTAFVAQADGLSIESVPAERPSLSADGGAKAPSQMSFVAAMVNAFVGKPLLFLGLILVVLGRGCDSTGMRSVNRTNAQYQQAKVAFQLEWDSKMSAQQQKFDKKNRELSELNELRFKKGGGPGDDNFNKKSDDLAKELNDLNKELGKLRFERNSQLIEKETGEWKPAKEAAQSAQNNHRMWVYWYELLFIFGTVVLVLGVLTLAFTGQGAERWVAYIIIAILTFSVYVGGFAWMASAENSRERLPIERDDFRFPK